MEKNNFTLLDFLPTDKEISQFKTRCHICAKNIPDWDWICGKCGEYVCENCIVPYTLHNQIDYTLCKFCDTI